MVRVRSSPREIDISGSREDLRVLRDDIEAFLVSPLTSITIPTDATFDPAPYGSALDAIHLTKGENPLHAQVQGKTLLISAEVGLLGTISGNLPCDAEHPTSGIQAHTHFPEYLCTSASPSIVLSLRRNGDG